MTSPILNTCDPYIIKYPIPAFDTINSPTITPTQLIPILILIKFIKFPIFDGITSLNKIWNLFAPKLFNKRIFSKSTFLKYWYADKIVNTKDIDTATHTIPFTPVPTQIIMIGARAVFGSAFKTIKNGSKIFAIKLFHHKIIDILSPITVPIRSPNIVSNTDIPIWLIKSLLYRENILQISLG